MSLGRWVKTGNGQAFADTMGVEAPPMNIEESVEGVLEQIDGASISTTSGSFVSYDGTIIPW
jgi:norsolorinic acid ketoreductase